MLSGVILGAPTLRLRGDYLAIVTLGFGEIVRITAINTDEIGGARGITPIPHPPPFLGVEFKLDPLPYYYFILFVIVLAIIFSSRLQRSRVGRAWTAIREDEDAAELMGVPTFKFKLLAFAIGAMIGGLAGVVFASKVIFIAPTNFPFILSATILAAVLLGGAGQPARRDPRRVPDRLAAGAVPRLRRLPHPGLRRGAGADHDAAPAGPAAVAAAQRGAEDLGYLRAGRRGADSDRAGARRGREPVEAGR